MKNLASIEYLPVTVLLMGRNERPYFQGKQPRLFHMVEGTPTSVRVKLRGLLAQGSIERGYMCTCVRGAVCLPPQRPGLE